MPQAGYDTKYGDVTSSEKDFLVGSTEGGDEAVEPVFVLRAQDPFAVNAILAYSSFCAQGGVDETHVEKVREAANNLEHWQLQNPDLVKDQPDS